MSSMITTFSGNYLVLLFILLPLILGLFYIVRKLFILRNNLKLNSVKVIKKGNSLTTEDAEFIESCILLKKCED